MGIFKRKKTGIKTKGYEIGICCISAKHAALRNRGQNWLARNQNNVSK